MAKLFSGAEVSAELIRALQIRVKALATNGVTPTLALLRVGENPSDLAYERGACKRAEAAGVAVRRIALPATVKAAELLCAIDRLNADDAVHGVLLFRPLPGELLLSEREICNRLSPQKDVDGMTDSSCAGVFMGTPLGFAPCTPSACMAVLDHYGIGCEGKRAVVLGRSLVVGKPVAMMLLSRNATVTVCHTRTRDLAKTAREADILITAAGVPGVVSRELVRPGMIVLDVGVTWSQSAGKVVGDVNFPEVEAIVEAITPVPGGVGTVTSTMLCAHVVEAAERTLR